ncbi:MAG: glycosyltransferase family 4 protein [Nitrospirae bacterium]|nr:glycosyltransferase family 4 protein [Nitrospirota bacterium]
MVESGIKADKIKVIYNGIDEKHWDRSNHHICLRKELRIPEDSIVVGTVGRIGNEKDYLTFLNVAKAVADKIDNVFFVIVGEGKGNEKEELIAYARKAGVIERVIFTGYRGDLLNVYKTFNIFLMTSITEGLPNTLLEAMSMGLPVVSTNVGGISELVVNDVSGFMYDVGDADGMAGKIIELISDKQSRLELSIASRRRIEEVFSFNKRLQIMEEYYLNLSTQKSNFN